MPIADPLSVLEDTQPDAERKGPARHAFFISTPRNLEPLLEEELRELGIVDVKQVYLGVEAKLSREEVYRVVYASRLASRVLRPLATFPCRNPDELYEHAVKFNWARILKEGQTLKVSASVSDSAITHSQYAALKLKDAVVDSLRERTGARPSIDRETPDVRLDLFLRHDQATISLYYSDGIMHRRGYRIQAVDAPLKENLAAAVLLFSKWKGDRPLVDLFCGSGTFLIEGAMIATHTPAGFFRETQGFETLPDFSESLWAKVKHEFTKAILPLPKGLITGVDISARAMAATRANLARTPWLDAVKLTQKDFAKLEGPYPDRTIVANPPYGVRLEDTQEGLQEFYKSLGQFLKTKCPDSKAYVLIPDKELEKEIWFKPERRLVIDNGALEVSVAEYSILPPREDAPARPDKADKAEKTEKAEKVEKPAKSEKAEKAAKPKTPPEK
ncbi:MAG: putative methylase family protein [Fibrobacteres bacterium]|nr:putative methylase family protein [Fibrobacterota bacterium]